MTQRTYLQTMSDTQRQFIAGAAAIGATSSAGARAGAELPRISARELIELLDTGIVREGAQRSYYVYLRARPAAGLEPTPSGTPMTPPHAVKLFVIVVFLLVIPIVFLLLSRGTR